MPGSLLLGGDTYSDVSEYSGRSLDSKIGGKKVSFNKAVRVKQYPWKPDVDVATSEHLTLPSNRFWFKVYKNKHDTPVSYDYATTTPKQNSWDEEGMEYTHDSLTPIAEVDDQEIETPKHTLSKPLDRNEYERGEAFNEYNGSYKSYDYQPSDPPVDYFNKMQLTSNIMNGARRVWEENGTKCASHGYDPYQSNISGQWNGNGYHYKPHDRIDENSENSYPSSMYDNSVLPRANFRNEFTTRRSMRRLDDSGGFATRERRSRSHDEYMDNDNRFKHLKKADKSVSTEDLNTGNVHLRPSNKFFKGSRDIATQCYGTLTRNKNQASFNNLNTSSFAQTNSYLSNTERLKSFKSQRPQLNFNNESNGIAASPKKDYSLEKVSSVIRSRIDSPKSNELSTQTVQNYNQYGKEFDLSKRARNDNLKPLVRTGNGIANIIQRQANRTSNRYNQKSEPNSIDIKHNRENTSQYNTSRQPSNTVFNRFNPRTELRSIDTKNNTENTIRNNVVSETNGVGFLRGHQIPLSEVNTNTNRKFICRNNPNHKTDENHGMVKLPSVTIKPESKGYQAKRYLSPPNNHERRSFRNASNSAKSYASEGDSSMIDWSLSGFQLAPKPENGFKSVSDSEYTVHRRAPLLMYIPGVSHHDRPAMEDDRLSALSDVSRSEINDGLSSLAGSSKDRSVIGDFRRRQSMREGKSKWLKWRSKT